MNLKVTHYHYFQAAVNVLPEPTTIPDDVLAEVKRQIMESITVTIGVLR